ncbi:MAG TPA: hypothetical protein PK765_04765 [bacterium]|nr:hypothetical protein [bacterium]
MAVSVGGSLGGIFGVLVALPVAAMIQIFARDWLASRSLSASS